MIRRTLGEVVRAWRIRRGMTLKDMHRLGFNIKHLSKVERGLVSASAKLIDRLGEALHVPSYILYEEAWRKAWGPDFTAKLEATVLPSGIVAVTTTVRINRSNVMQWSADMFNAAREHRVSNILLPSLITDLSEQDRHEAANNTAEWLMGQNFTWPKIAMVTNSILDKYGEPLVRERGLRIALFPTVDESERWLKSRD